MDGRVTAIPPVNAGATSKLVIKAPSITEVHDAMKTLADEPFLALVFFSQQFNQKEAQSTDDCHVKEVHAKRNDSSIGKKYGLHAQNQGHA